jgi:hypothetical protein
MRRIIGDQKAGEFNRVAASAETNWLIWFVNLRLDRYGVSAFRLVRISPILSQNFIGVLPVKNAQNTVCSFFLRSRSRRTVKVGGESAKRLIAREFRTELNEKLHSNLA